MPHLRSFLNVHSMYNFPRTPNRWVNWRRISDLFQWCFGAPCRLAPRVAAWLASPLFRPSLSQSFKCCDCPPYCLKISCVLLLHIQTQSFEANNAINRPVMQHKIRNSFVCYQPVLNLMEMCQAVSKVWRVWTSTIMSRTHLWTFCEKAHKTEIALAA